jgi:hypothetical protein
LYARGGFVFQLALIDKEFNKNGDLLGLLEMNTTAASEHVGKVEREIRLTKERTRCATTGFSHH